MAARTSAELSERPVAIPIGSRRLIGTLAVPRGARALILFAHGSGSGRFSPRNQFVAQALQDAGLGTLLVDLLEANEAEDRRKVFDIELLADRLLAAAHWLGHDPETRDLRLGYFGASTGAAAALVAAACRPERVGAIVSRGGRPDLAREPVARGHGSHPLDRRQSRRGCPRAEPAGPGPAALPEGADHRPGGHSSLPRAGGPRGGRPAREAMVPAVPGHESRPERSKFMIPFRTILVAADLSESSRQAFTLACSLAHEHKTRIFVLNVIEPKYVADGAGLPRPADRSLHSRREGSIRARIAEGAVGEVYVPDQPLDVEYQTREGNAAEEILRSSKDLGCDLIVMGTHGRTGLRRLLAGSIAETVLREARCPVLALRCSDVPRAREPIPTILHPTDFSECSESAVQIARSLRGSRGAPHSPPRQPVRGLPGGGDDDGRGSKSGPGLT